MAHKDWFGRKSITLRSEKIFLKTRTNDEATLNGFPLLTTSNGAVTALGPFGNTPNANGASLAASTLTLQPANATFPGGVTTGAQSFAGVKSFTNGVTLTGASTSNGLPIIAGTNVNEMLFIQNVGSMNFTT